MTARYPKRKNAVRDTRGVTLLELILVLALTGLVLSCVYLFFSFSIKSFEQTQASSGMLQDTSLFLSRIEKEFRQAQNPDGPAVEIYHNGVGGSEGSQVVIHTYDDTQSPTLVSYRVNGGRLERAQKNGFNSVFGENDWSTVIPLVSQKDTVAFFRITDTKKIVITFLVADPEGNVETPVEITNTFTVRSKEAM